MCLLSVSMCTLLFSLHGSPAAYVDQTFPAESGPETGSRNLIVVTLIKGLSPLIDGKT